MKGARCWGPAVLAWLLCVTGVVAWAKAEGPSATGAPREVQAGGSDAGTAMASDRSSAEDEDVEQTAFLSRLRRPRPCPPGWRPVAPEAPAPTEAAPGAKAPTEAAPGAVAPETAAVPPGALAGTIGAAGGPTATAPYMIGDFFGGGARFFGASTLGGIQNTSVGEAGGNRRFKIVEGNSPIPQDRLFFTYSHFVNPVVNVREQAVDVNSFTFGVEKTLFGDDLTSVELRVPFASGFDSTQSLDPAASLAGTEFGDLALSFKRVILRREHFLLSAGLALVFATGRDFSIVGEDPFSQSAVPVTLLSVQNQSTHLQPFLGAAWRPNDRLFFLFFTQWDFDARGNAVFMRDQGTLSQVGVFQEQNLWFLDFNVGYWLYRNPCARWITGMAPIIELHYSTTMQNEDQVTGPLGTIGLPPEFETPRPGQPTDFHGRRDVLDLTAGLQFELGACSSLTVAGVAPLKSGLNRDYDAEFVVQFNRRF